MRDGDGTARLRKVRQGEPYLLHDGSGVTDAQLTGALARANGEVSSLKSELAKEPRFPVLLLNCYTFPNADVAAATAAQIEGVFAKLFADNLREIARTDATEAKQLPLTRGTLQHWLDEGVIRTGGWNAGLMTGNKAWADEQIALAEADPAAQAVARPPLPPSIQPHPLALLRLRRPASVARSLARGKAFPFKLCPNGTRPQPPGGGGARSKVRGPSSAARRKAESRSRPCSHDAGSG